MNAQTLLSAVRPLLAACITMPMGKLNELIADVERSFGTPQVGPYHCEGPFMDSHLVGVANALDAVGRGEFHPDVPTEVWPFMMAAARTRADIASAHVVLHDVDKLTTMTFVKEDGGKVAVTYDEWVTLIDGDPDGDAIRKQDAAALERFCARHGITQISYYHDSEGGKISHGKKAADRLRDYAEPLLVKGIETHEVAFLFGDRGGINLPLFHEHFGAWSEADVAYALLVNYADQMGSLKPDGQPDISDFVWLAKTWRAYVDFQVVKANLEGLRLDQHKASRLMDTLWKSKDVFQSETIDAVIARIRSECELRSFSEAQVRNALVPVIGLSPDIADAIVADMTKDGKLSPDTGKKLGGLNKAVRGALASLS